MPPSEWIYLDCRFWQSDRIDTGCRAVVVIGATIATAVAAVAAAAAAATAIHIGCNAAVVIGATAASAAAAAAATAATVAVAAATATTIDVAVCITTQCNTTFDYINVYVFVFQVVVIFKLCILQWYFADFTLWFISSYHIRQYLFPFIGFLQAQIQPVGCVCILVTM